MWTLWLLRQVKGVIQFIITPGGAWVVDLKNGNGSVTEGKANGKVDMTLTVSDADMVAIASGKLNAQQVGWLAGTCVCYVYVLCACVWACLCACFSACVCICVSLRFSGSVRGHVSSPLRGCSHGLRTMARAFRGSSLLCDVTGLHAWQAEGEGQHGLGHGTSSLSCMSVAVAWN